jgi:hypothetical protein
MATSIELSSSDAYWTLQTAVKYGGGFHKRLAEAGLCADHDNRRKLFETWPDLIAVYGPQTLPHRQLREGWQ